MSDKEAANDPNLPASPAKSSQIAGPLPPASIIYRSEELMQGGREVWIEHGCDMYRLRITAAGKLLLTK